jgi:hypothetical protein
LAEELGDAHFGESIALDNADRLISCLVLAIEEPPWAPARRCMLEKSRVRDHAGPVPAADHAHPRFRNRARWTPAIPCERDTMPRR